MSWFEDQDQYRRDVPFPSTITPFGGPRGLAVLNVYSEGRTTKGWGLRDQHGQPAFMPNYRTGRFRATQPRLYAQGQARPVALVMRSVNLVMLDIDRHTEDGGTDGFIAARRLKLPPTLAETSKSGTGRHLFYAAGDVWDSEEGFARWDDAIGLYPGIDLRAVGCSYRYPQQRWNELPIAPLPENLRELLDRRKERKEFTARQFAAIAAADPNDEDALIMHDALLQELNSPIQTGQRNNSLFAIGSKMREAGFPNWEQELYRRGTEIGLGSDEVAKIVDNVGKYAA